MLDPSFQIFGVPITPLSRIQIIGLIKDAMLSTGQRLIFNVNAHCLNLAYKDPHFRGTMCKADTNFIDGIGVLLAARILGHRLSSGMRNTPPDWIDDLAMMCISESFSMFFLGAKPGIASRAANVLLARNPGLAISGTHHGYFTKTVDSTENRDVLDKINNSRADILLVGFGMPMQEYWILENKSSIVAKVILPVGALFDYLAGETRRGPKILTNRGLEWLTRLIIEPGRLWSRYIIGNPLFIYRVLKQRFGFVDGVDNV
jgi:N-acetylglucosaminyldiphosphoundecaprenol N-acetyl-beta-D-mannosaminyltransferase